MRILIIDKTGMNAIKETSILPRKGDKIDIFYKPYPEVSVVLLYPSDEALKEIGIEELDIKELGIDAFIFL